MSEQPDPLAGLYALAEDWEARCESYRGTGNYPAQRFSTDELRDALAEASEQVAALVDDLDSVGARANKYAARANRAEFERDELRAVWDELRAAVAALADEWKGQLASGLKIRCGRLLSALLDDPDQALREVKAEVWDEGHADGVHNEHEFRDHRVITNPYRGGDA